jgi:hypothetical protein
MPPLSKRQKAVRQKQRDDEGKIVTMMHVDNKKQRSMNSSTTKITSLTYIQSFIVNIIGSKGTGGQPKEKQGSIAIIAFML